MDEKDDTNPFPREPWQRLLAEDGDGPPETTDARVRAAARRNLPPRGRRWWLPASLAASVVLAVFVVQSQLGTVRTPVMNESEHGDGGAVTARIADREDAEVPDEPRLAGQAPAAAGQRKARSREAAEADDYGHPDAELAADSTGSGPTVGGPERELQAANEMPDDLPASASRREVPDPATADSAGAAAGLTPQYATTTTRPPPFEKSPETWYAYIEKLREQGKTEEADRQLERLEQAHPGWVERHLRNRERQ